MTVADVVPPTNQDVADLLRARTKDDAMNELGGWSSETRPTDTEVDNLIVLATGDVLAQTGAQLEQRDAESARTMIALRAAMFVELSYWPEQVNSDRSAYHEYERLYNDGMTALLESIEGGGVVADAGAGYTSLPVTSWTQLPVEEVP